MNKIAADIKFEKGKEDILLDISKKFVDKFSHFIEVNIPKVAASKNVSEERVRNAPIYSILKALAKDSSNVSVNNKCTITDVNGTKRNIYFKINMSPQEPGSSGGFFSKHLSGGLTAAPKNQQDVVGLRQHFGIPDLTINDKVISVDMSAFIPYSEFAASKHEAEVAILGVLSHELSHAYSITTEKSDKKYFDIMKNLEHTKEQEQRILNLVESKITLTMEAANKGKTPEEMASILKTKASELHEQSEHFFAQYLNTQDEISSALKELRVFVNAMASGKFVSDFDGIKGKFKNMSMAEKQSTIKNLLSSIGTWNRIGKYLTEENRRLVFKFIYKLLTEEPNVIKLQAPRGEGVIPLRESYPETFPKEPMVAAFRLKKIQR